MTREIDFTQVRHAKEKIAEVRSYMKGYDSFGFFMVINILLYGLLVTLSILRLFGLI